MAETVPGYEITQTRGIVAPAGTPDAVIRRLTADIVKVMNEPDVKQRVLSTGAVPVSDTPTEFETFMAKERQRLGDVIARSGIVLNE